ncbi:MAG: type I site-specific restriction-modification system restriction subunit HsdR [Rhodobacteraceae bacterium HLUCCO18]|nr:MAG: type I site-specific restriction-modification system restriction subunit HsdR [Rhodobacteraceae bacterium HLUCCO18]
MSKSEAFSRVKIDALLRDAGWTLDDGTSVLYEYTLADGTRADYVLCDRAGRPMAVLEAKRTSVDPIAAQDQGRYYADLLDVPFVFLANGEEVWHLDRHVDAHARKVATVFSQSDLERRIAVRSVRRKLSDVDTDKAIAGRPYQLECIETLCTEIERGRRKLLVEMATGTGKTRTAAAFIKRLFEASQITRVLFLVDRIELARQAEEALVDHLSSYPSYILKGARGIDHAKRITVATLQTMVNEYDQLSSGYFDLIIVDECHRSIYGKFSGVLRHFDGIKVGLTATPCTVNPDDISDEEDAQFVRDTLRFFEVTEPTFRYTLPEAIEDGHLVPYRIYKAMTVKTAADGGFPVKRDELDWTAMDEETKAEFEELFDGSETIKVDPRALERKFTIPERNRAIVREFREVLENGFKGTDGIKRTPRHGKTIVFAVTKKHAETLATMFDTHFADLKPHSTTRYADFVVSDVGSGPTEGASDKIKRFKKEEFPKILVSVNMLDTGFDCPEVVNLVMARFTQSAILYQQMRGRGTRQAPHIHKSAFTMFDFVGVTDFHGDDEENIPGGIVIQGKPTTGPSQPRRLLELDVHDHIDPASRDWVTLDENGRIVRTDEHVAAANALGMRFQAWMSKRAWDVRQERWLGLIESSLKTEAMNAEGFWEYDLDEHPFDKWGGYNEAVRVFGGEAALEEMLASLNVDVFPVPPRAGTSDDDSVRPTA